MRGLSCHHGSLARATTAAAAAGGCSTRGEQEQRGKRAPEAEPKELEESSSTIVDRSLKRTFELPAAARRELSSPASEEATAQ
jgi:hypothetical protein